MVKVKRETKKKCYYHISQNGNSLYWLRSYDQEGTHEGYKGADTVLFLEEMVVTQWFTL